MYAEQQWIQQCSAVFAESFIGFAREMTCSSMGLCRDRAYVKFEKGITSCSVVSVSIVSFVILQCVYSEHIVFHVQL